MFGKITACKIKMSATDWAIFIVKDGDKAENRNNAGDSQQPDTSSKYQDNQQPVTSNQPKQHQSVPKSRLSRDKREGQGKMRVGVGVK